MLKRPHSTGERLMQFENNIITLEHLHRYAITAELVSGKLVVDIACGEGYGSALLAKKAMQVTGIDLDPAIIDYAQKKYQRKNLSFMQGSILQIPLDDHVADIVVSFETLEHVGDHEKVFAEIKRILKPGGLLILSTPDKNFYSDQSGHKNPFHVRELYPDNLSELALKFFQKGQLYRQISGYFSLIISDHSDQGTEYFTGDFQQLNKLPIIPAPYVLLLASDQSIPPIPSSTFTNPLVLDQMLTDKEVAIKETYSYKIGHALLYPFKILRNFFRSSKKKQG